MPDYDRQSTQSPERVHPPTPDEEERVAIHCAAQHSRGLTSPAQALEFMRMLGVEQAAIDISSRHHAHRGDQERAQAAVLELKTAKKKRRRAS